MKNRNGITLISLVITIIVLVILASVATYSGINAINSSKRTAFTTELKIMQTQVNSIYQKYRNNDIITIDDIHYYGEADKDDSTKTTILKMGQELKSQDISLFTQLSKDPESGITTEQGEGYRYWSNDFIKKLGIEGVEQDFFVNVEKRSIVSYKGFQYEGKTYYTLSQLPDGLYNVEYIEPSAEKPTFDISTEYISTNKWRITISNIHYDGYINKWQVRYQLEGKDFWNTTEDLSFVVNKGGNYKVQIFNGEVKSEENNFSLVTIGEIVTEKNKTHTKNGTAVIPVGFAIVPGLDDVSEGLVISDDSEDTEVDSSNIVAKGNQFVWIPVLDSTPYERNKTYSDANISATAIDDTDYLPEGVTKTEEQLVRNAGGFYIARYESGIGTNPVSKKETTVWADIAQTETKEKAKTFINNNYVKSALISGTQWDMTMAFISSKPRVDGTGAPYDVTEVSDTRHRGDSVGVEKTGSNISDKVCNIYDLEGNAYEYIAEKNTYGSNPYVYRGGDYYNRNAASYRYINGGIASSYRCFRLVLYVM